MPLAGFSYEILAEGHFVPGLARWEMVARFKGKDLWKEIMRVSEESTVLYGQRVILTFEGQVKKDASNKNKALLAVYDLFGTSQTLLISKCMSTLFPLFNPNPLPCQKSAQISLEDHLQLMDIVLVWLWLRPKLEASLEGSLMARMETMFLDGRLDNGVL